jgi:Uma2 family endonuclease
LNPARALEAAFGEGFHVRRQEPLILSGVSEPEPDLLVVAGSYEDYVAEHPETQDIRLLVEVSDTSLRFDRGRKAALYARGGIEDYWIMNLSNRTLEVRREPAPVAGSRRRFACRSVETLSTDDQIAPLSRPGALLRVGDLFPPH